MEAALAQSKSMCVAVQQLSSIQEDLDRKLREEQALHQQTKQRLAEIEDAHQRMRIDYDSHAADLSVAKSKLQQEQAAHAKTREELNGSHQSTLTELASLQDELAKANIAHEAHTSAFVGQIKSYEQRQIEMSAKLEASRDEYETLHATHSQTRSALDSALKAQDAYRKQYHATHEELARIKDEYKRCSEELTQQKTDLVPVEKLRNELAATQAEATKSRQQGAQLKGELDAQIRLNAEKASALQQAELRLAQSEEELKSQQMKVFRIEAELQDSKSKTLELLEEHGRLNTLLQGLLAKAERGDAQPDLSFYSVDSRKTLC